MAIVPTTSPPQMSVDSEVEVIYLTAADQRLFAEAIMSPPKPNEALKRALESKSKLLKP